MPHLEIGFERFEENKLKEKKLVAGGVGSLNLVNFRATNEANNISKMDGIQRGYKWIRMGWMDLGVGLSTAQAPN